MTYEGRAVSNWAAETAGTRSSEINLVLAITDVLVGVTAYTRNTDKTIMDVMDDLDTITQRLMFCMSISCYHTYSVQTYQDVQEPTWTLIVKTEALLPVAVEKRQWNSDRKCHNFFFSFKGNRQRLSLDKSYAANWEFCLIKMSIFSECLVLT